jgi:uncharacterized RDD family membrane protein YckC
MMTTETMSAERFITRVLDAMPRGTPQREQIALELRAHIEERCAHGHSLGEVLGQLGDPLQLADRYLAANPLVPAPFGGRIAAKLIDASPVVAIVALLAWLWSRSFPYPPSLVACLLVVLVCAGPLLCVYTMLAEYFFAQTWGKRLFGLQVVRESGRRIGLGQAVVRQLPFFLSIYCIDAVFALFTDKRQRAFELLSKTRVVVASSREET